MVAKPRQRPHARTPVIFGFTPRNPHKSTDRHTDQQVPSKNPKVANDRAGWYWRNRHSAIQTMLFSQTLLGDRLIPMSRRVDQAEPAVGSLEAQTQAPISTGEAKSGPRTPGYSHCKAHKPQEPGRPMDHHDPKEPKVHPVRLKTTGGQHADQHAADGVGGSATKPTALGD